MESPTEFLKHWISEFEKEKGRGAQSLLCRRAGFASRSYLSELLSGKKKFSRDSLSRIKSAMRLTGSQALYFETLVLLDQPELRLKNEDDGQLKLRLKKTRLEWQQNNQNPKKATPILGRPEFFQIYAALGGFDVGASVEEVLSRTGLAARYIHKALKELVQLGVIEYKNERYYASVSKLDHLDHKNQNNIVNMMESVCQGLKNQAQSLVQDPLNLNVYSALSVKRDKIPQLKKDLEKALFAVLDEYQEDNGDCVEQVFVSLFRKPVLN